MATKYGKKSSKVISARVGNSDYRRLSASAASLGVTTGELVRAATAALSDGDTEAAEVLLAGELHDPSLLALAAIDRGDPELDQIAGAIEALQRGDQQSAMQVLEALLSSAAKGIEAKPAGDQKDDGLIGALGARERRAMSGMTAEQSAKFLQLRASRKRVYSAREKVMNRAMQLSALEQKTADKLPRHARERFLEIRKARKTGEL